MVANISQRKSSKGIATTWERGTTWRKIVGLRKNLRRVMSPLPIRRKIVIIGIGSQSINCH